MKHSGYVIAVILVVIISLPMGLDGAQKSLPQVPITYPGDTNETIIRRAQWIEGAKKEGALDWWGIQRPNEVTGVISGFNKVYPFIKVEYWRGEGEAISAKLDTNFTAGKHSCDLAIGGEENNFPRWRQKGYLQKYTEIIPGIKNWDKRLYGSHRDAAQVGNNATVPQYNTKLVSAAEAPKSWEDLLDPKWKGHLGLATDPKTWWTLALAEGGWGIDKATDYIKKLKAQKPNMSTGIPQGHALLVAGEFKINVWGFMRHVLTSQENNAPVNWSRVNPIPITGPSLIMPAYGAHPNAASLFAEWFLSHEGLNIWEKATYFGSAFPGSGSRLSEILKGLSFAVRTEEVIVKAVELGLDQKYGELLMVK